MVEYFVCKCNGQDRYLYFACDVDINYSVLGGYMAITNELYNAVKLMQQGNEQGFNYVYSQTYNYVYARAKYIMQDDDDAIDLLQETYIQAYKNIGSLEDPNNVYAWLGAVTYNQGMKIFRKKKEVLLDEEAEGLFDTIEDENIEWSPEESTDKNETANILMNIIDELPPLQKAAIVAFYYDNMKIEDIANAEGCSPNTIKSRLNYAKKYIKNRVEEMQKQGGYKLYSINIPAILLAIWWLSNKASNTLSPAAASNAYQATKYKMISYAAQSSVQNMANQGQPFNQAYAGPASQPMYGNQASGQMYGGMPQQQMYGGIPQQQMYGSMPQQGYGQQVPTGTVAKAAKKGFSIGKALAGLGLTAAVATGGVVGYDAVTGEPFGLFIDEITNEDIQAIAGTYTGKTRFLLVLESDVKLTIGYNTNGTTSVNVQLNNGTSVLNETMDKVYVDGDKLKFEKTTDVDYYEGYITIEDDDSVKFYFTISGAAGSTFGNTKVKVSEGTVLKQTK